MWFCHRCGQWATVRVKGLKEGACQGKPSKGGNKVLDLLGKGLFPNPAVGGEANIFRSTRARR